jgi:hypothetical protein
MHYQPPANDFVRFDVLTSELLRIQLWRDVTLNLRVSDFRRFGLIFSCMFNCKQYMKNIFFVN